MDAHSALCFRQSRFRSCLCNVQNRGLFKYVSSFLFLSHMLTVYVVLDELSTWLRADEFFGYAVLFCMIFLTTIRTCCQIW